MTRQYVVDHNVVDRYLLGQLGQDEQDAFETYYLSCPDTLDELSVTEKLMDSFAASALGARARRRPATDSSEKLESVKPRDRTRPWKFATLAASVLAAVTLALPGLQSGSTPDFGGSEDLNIPIITLAATRSTGDARIIELPRAPVRVAIALDLGLANHSTYEVQLINNEKQTIWSAVNLTPDDFAALTFSLPPGILEPGGYEFVAKATGSEAIELALSVLVQYRD